MTYDEAAELLEKHNMWRQGWIEDAPCTPKQLTQAIDVAIEALRKHG